MTTTELDAASDTGDIVEPTVSIVLPTHTEIGFIRDCLDSILAQDYSSIIEVLVVDGGSDDGGSDDGGGDGGQERLEPAFGRALFRQFIELLFRLNDLLFRLIFDVDLHRLGRDVLAQVDQLAPDGEVIDGAAVVFGIDD